MIVAGPEDAIPRRIPSERAARRVGRRLFRSRYREPQSALADPPAQELHRGKAGHTLPARSPASAYRERRDVARRRQRTPRAGPIKTKTPPPRREAAFCLIVTRKEELLCPRQAWQRPTLP